MFTGGGSAGHVTVNLALIPCFFEEGWSVEYMGSENCMEKQLISSIANVGYHGIATGKLRSYFDWKIINDPFKVVRGVLQAFARKGGRASGNLGNDERSTWHTRGGSFSTERQREADQIEFRLSAEL
jgi:hypothetical protein